MKALRISEISVQRGYPDGFLMEITKVYALDAVYDTPEDVPKDVKSSRHYAGIDILLHLLANGPEIKRWTAGTVVVPADAIWCKHKPKMQAPLRLQLH
ncbi:hypothetical protein Tco_0319363 [Tanacetum coccineum]